MDEDIELDNLGDQPVEEEETGEEETNTDWRDESFVIRDLKIAVYGKRLTSRNSFVMKSKS